MEKNFKIIDTTDYMSYDDYKELCEANDWEIAPENSEEYWNTVTSQINLDIDDFWVNLKYSKLKDEKFFISGNLGLWDGNKKINPVLADGIYNAISRCITGSINDFDVEFKDGELYVNARHHDGTNRFVINQVSAHGKRFIDRMYVDERGFIMYPDKCDDIEIKRDYVKKIELDKIC